MATSLSDVIHHLRYAALARDADGLTDSELLERFLVRRDEAAFAALVRRHGPMVLGVCRRLLRHAQDVEDAFQATFLVLIQKAASIVRRELLGNWLYGVAYRTASKARAAAVRRQARERQVSDMPDDEPAATKDDVLALLDQELNRLPEKYRTPIVLCDLEGRPRGEVAERLACPLGTGSSRLARGRAMLRQRLTHRGVTLTATALAAVLTESTSAAIPAALAVNTVKAGLTYAAGTGGVSASIVALTEGVLKTMFLTKLKIATVVVLMLGVVGAGAGLVLRASLAGESPTARQGEKPRTAGNVPSPSAKAAMDSLLNVFLLHNDSVQKELKLNDKQLRKIQKVRADIRAKHKEELDKTIDEAKKNGNAIAIGAALRKAQQVVEGKIRLEEQAALAKALPNILKDDQMERLRQLSLQRVGTHVFMKPEVAKFLMLTEEQKKKVAAIDAKTHEEVEKKFRHGNILGPIEVGAFDKIMRTAVEKVVVDVLTEEQERTWKEMQGEPFEIQRTPLGGKVDKKKD